MPSMCDLRLIRAQTADPTVSVLVLEARFANLNEDSLSVFTHSHSLHPSLTLLSHVWDVWEEY